MTTYSLPASTNVFIVLDFFPKSCTIISLLCHGNFQTHGENVPFAQTSFQKPFEQSGPTAAAVLGREI